MRFTIRDLVWLTLVIALMLGLFAQMQRNYQLEVENYNLGRAIWDSGYEAKEWKLVPRRDAPQSRVEE